MNCPPEIARALLGVLRVALLRARAACARGDAGRCALEADHVHNLPSLLADYSEKGLRFYGNVERRAYLDRLASPGPTGYEGPWATLAGFLSAPASP